MTRLEQIEKATELVAIANLKVIKCESDYHVAKAVLEQAQSKLTLITHETIEPVDAIHKELNTWLMPRTGSIGNQADFRIKV